MNGDGHGGPPPLPPGGPGCGPGACNWKLHIKVHSEERFWPKAAFQVEFGAINPPAPPPAAPPAAPPPAPAGPDLTPHIGPWYQHNVTMTSKHAHEVLFTDSGPKNGGVTATVNAIRREADWVLASGLGSTALLANQYQAESINDGQEHFVDLFVRHPLKVYLEFKFKDPENKIFKFPKDFPIQVWDTAKILEKKTDEKGRVDFELDRSHDWVTLKFGNAPVYFSVGDGTIDKCELKTQDDVNNTLEKSNAKFFGPPDSWALIESTWQFSEQPKFISGAQAYKDNEAKIYLFKAAGPDWVRRIGEKDAPITLTLDPHWQFNRFEFFDRYYGHSDHGHKRVDMPPVTVLGYSNHGAKTEGKGHWVLSPTSITDSVHALPWIRQKDLAGAKAEQPDKNALIQFLTWLKSYVISTDANTRKMDVVPDADPNLKPAANRLKYYDLPDVWKSAGYWTRFLKGPNQYDAKFWEDWDTPDRLKSRDVKKPMIFSLDDIVLCDNAVTPLALADADRFAIFYHRFAKDYDEAGNVTDEGVHNFDPAEPYFSKTKRKGPKFNYIADYPNWVRAVAGLSSCFDAFAQRTAKDVFGARAAVRVYDGTTGTAAGTAIAGWPGPQSNKYYVIEPEFGQKYAQTNLNYVGPGTTAQRIGRFDMVLLRCCDRIGANELFMNVQYFRMTFNFLAAAPANALPGAAGSAIAAPGIGFYSACLTNLMKRWNGHDGAVSAARAKLTPQNAANIHQGEVIYFLQPNAALAGSHYRLDVFKGTINDRDFMDSNGGVGQILDNHFQADGAHAPNSFTVAHETGHGGSMPDEYGEWWSTCSYKGPGFLSNTPADPYQDDGQSADLNVNLYTGKPQTFGMMNSNVELRNRYFWHNAEYARKRIDTTQPFFVELGAYNQFKVPGNSGFPNKNFTYWPIRENLGLTNAPHGKVDVYLQAFGKDRFSVDVMPGGPWDGMLTLLIKIDMTVAATLNITDVRDIIRQAILTFNQTFSASGTTAVNTDAGNQNLAMPRIRVRFSPRFLISNVDANQNSFVNLGANYAAEYATLQGYSPHFTAFVLDNKGLAAPVVSNFLVPAANVINFGIDSSKAWKPGLTADVQRLLPQMLGITLAGAALAGPDLKPLAQAVIDTNAVVV